jgi:purine nucleosidase
MNPVLLDCDPGIDDALAIALAAGSTDIDLVGITTVAGNVGLPLTTLNALALREFLELGDLPVHAGSDRALVRDQIHAAHVHGPTGLGDAVLPAPARPVSDGHAVDFIISTLAARPGEITLVAVGPLTNIALAVRREPRIVTWAREMVVMGGSFTRGNSNPAAEFNILTDPEAAAVVFGAGWTVTQIGLDVTLTAQINTALLDRMRPLGRLSSLVVPAASFYGHVTTDGGPALHDACALAYAISPSLMGFTPARVEVETVGRFTTGMTVTDFTSDTPNARVATSFDVPGFWDVLLDSYQRLGARLG